MERYNLMLLIREKIGAIVLFGIFLASLSFLFLVISQKNFRVTTDYLIVQDKDENQDYYSLSRSVEYITKIFSEVVYSDLFIEEALNTGKMSAEFIPFDKKNRLKKWSKIVKIDANPEVGFISITVYGNNKGETLGIAEAISQVLVSKSYLFHGSGVNVDVRKMSGPITENNPTVLEIIMVIAGGFLIGILLGFIRFFYLSSHGRNNFQNFSLNNQSAGSCCQSFEMDEYKESLKYLER